MLGKDSKKIQVIVSKKDAKKIEKLAEKDDRSVSAWIYHLIKTKLK